MLTVIGIDPLEESLYLTLLKQPGQTRKELALSLPATSRTKLASAIDALLARGLVTALAGRPVRYTPIAPDVAVTALAQQQMNDAKAAQQLIPELMEMFWDAPRGTGLDFVEIITGPVEVLSHRVRQLHAAAQDIVRVFERPPFPWSPAADTDVLHQHLEPNVSAEQRLIDQGVVHQVIYEYEQVDDSDRWHADIGRLLASGEEGRVLPALPLKLIIFDDVAATTPLLDATGGFLGSLVVHQSPLLDALSALFDSYWARAVPLTPMGGGDAEADDSLDQELVMLLSAGLTDEAIARTLNISRSTVLRRVKDLMTQTGSRSRFQLGLQIGRISPS